MTPTLVLVVGLLGAAAFLSTWVIASWLANIIDPAYRRLASMSPIGAPGTTLPTVKPKWEQRLSSLGSWLLRGSKGEQNRIERLLFLSGFREPSSSLAFFGTKAMLLLILPLGWLIASGWLPTLFRAQRWPVALLVALLALIGPNRWLERRVARRQRRLRDGFPDALDMLVICVEAGLGLTSAIARVAEELQYTHPDLAAEMEIVNAEMRTGVDREVALNNLNVRTGLREIRGLVTLLVQTLRFGTGIADSLRVYSAEFRDQRMQAAEERAGKIGTKLIFPLIFCEFPGFFVIAVGPATLRLMEVFGK